MISTKLKTTHQLRFHVLNTTVAPSDGQSRTLVYSKNNITTILYI